MATRCKSSYLKINGIWARCLYAGSGPLGVARPPRKVVLVIPGNPGLSEFYDSFVSQIRTNMHTEDLPVWCLGHAGHDALDDGDGKDPIPAGKELSSLQSQISQKVTYFLPRACAFPQKIDGSFLPFQIAFLNQYVLKDNEDCEVTMIGHSVGVLIALKTMERLQKDSKAKFKVYGIFPMIERMYETPAGRRAWIHAAYLSKLIVGLIWCLNKLLPLTCRQCVAAFYVGTNDQGCLNAVCDLVNAARVYHVLNMGYTELKEVKELDYDFMRDNAENIRLYYGTHDDWCPIEYYSDMKRNVPQIKAELCTLDLPHAFVLKDSSQMAKTVTNWLIEDKFTMN